MDTARTYLLDEDSIKKRVLLNPEFSKLLVMWNDLGKPKQWNAIETAGGQYDYSLGLDEYELDQLSIDFEPSSKTYWCNQYYFSDLAQVFLG